MALRHKDAIAGRVRENEYENAAGDASRETGWSFPVSGNFKEYWIKQRMKRHLFFYLYTESAHKFKYKQINLNHRFDHYGKMLKMMDEAYVKAVDERPDLFAGVSVSHLFGTKVSAGFSYQRGTGRDTTYRESNEVDFGPKAAD